MTLFSCLGFAHRNPLMSTRLFRRILSLFFSICVPFLLPAQNSSGYSSISELKSSAANKDNIFLNTNLKLIGKGLHCYITDGNDFIIVESGSPLFSKSPGYTFNGLKGIYNSSKKHEITSGVPGEEVNAEIAVPEPTDISESTSDLNINMHYVAITATYQKTNSVITNAAGKKYRMDISTGNLTNNKKYRFTGFVNYDEYDNVYYIDILGYEDMNPVLILVTSDPNDGGKAWIGDDRNENQKSFEKNSRTTIHAAPAPGFRFLEWTFGDNQTFFSNDKDADITVTSQGTYTARFVEATEPELFTLEVNSSAGGSAMIEGDVNMFEAGTEVTVRAVAEPGYVFDGWFDSSTDRLESKSETYTFNITANTSVYAKFSAIQASETYTLSLTAGSGGSVAIAGHNELCITVNTPASVSLSATPDNGYSFSGWFENETLISEDNPYSFTVNSNTALVGRFSKSVSPTASGTLQELLDGRLDESGEISLTGTYQIALWDRLGNQIYLTDGTNVFKCWFQKLTNFSQGDIISGLSFNILDIKGGKYGTVLAGAALPEIIDNKPVNIQMSDIGLSDMYSPTSMYKCLRLTDVFLQITKNDVGDDFYRLGDNAYTSGTFTKPVYIYAPAEVLGDIKPSSYDYTVGKRTYCTVTGFLEYFSDRDEPALIATSIEPVDEAADSYTLSVSAEGSGSVWIGENKSNTTGRFTHDTQATVHADADEGWVFSGWVSNGVSVSTAADYTLNITGDSSLKAIFVENEKPETPQTRTITISSSNPSKGSVRARDFDSDIIETGSDVTIIAEPASDNDYFVHWISNGETFTENPFTYTGAESASFTAVFSSRYSVSFTSPSNGVISVIRADNGSTLLSGSTVEEGTEIIILFKANAGYRVNTLYINDIAVHHESTKFRTTVTKPITIKGTLDSNTSGTRQISVVSSDIEKGIVYINTPGTTSVQTSTDDLTILHAEPAIDCVFSGWELGNSSARIPGAVYTVPAALNDCHYTGVFDYRIQTPRTVTVKSSDPTKGSVSIKDCNTLSITSQRYVSVEASPASTYDKFVCWTDANGVELSRQPLFVYSGEADIELTANFKSSYPIYYSTEGNGNLSVVSDSDSKEIASGETLPDGATLIINAVADEHHELTALNLNGSETDLSLLPIRINISGRLDIRAVFAPVHYSIVVKQAVHGNLEVYRELDSFGRGSGTPFGSNDRAPYSTTLYIFATPDSEYSLTAVRVNDKVMLPEKGESYIKHTLDSHICIEPVFTATSSIAAERIDSNEIEAVYDLHGRYLGTSVPAAKGIYIVRINGKTLKIARM